MREAGAHPLQRGSRFVGWLLRDPVKHPTRLLARFNEPGLLEDGEMLGNSGGSQVEQLGHLTEAKFAALLEREQGADAIFIAERHRNGQKPPHHAPFVISPINEI